VTSEATGDTKVRWITALTFAALAVLYAGARIGQEPGHPTDFDQLWHAARALLAGRDPYSVVGPGREFEWTWPLYYPLPAVLLATPFTLLPVALARVVFTGLAAGALGYALEARSRALWPLLLSASFLIAVSRTQWSPVILASMWVPVLAVVTTAKPNLGLSALAAHTERRALMTAVVVCAGIVVLSFLVRPDWVVSWRSAISKAPHVTAPVARPLGFLLLLAALKWRRADARVFLMMSCIPHTPSLYDLLPLFFVCRSLRETLGLALLTHALFWGIIVFGGWNTFEGYYAGLGQAEVLVVFLPVLVTLLMRPNSAEMAAPVPGASWRDAIPATRLDAALSGLVFIGAFLLVWLPLAPNR
jgi:hypothetical protein